MVIVDIAFSVVEASLLDFCKVKGSYVSSEIFFSLNSGSLSLMFGISTMVIRFVYGVFCIFLMNVYFGSRDGGSMNLRLYYSEFVLVLNGVNCKEW